MMRTAIARLACLSLAIGPCAASVACGGAAHNAGVTILIPWAPKSDAGEWDAFNAVIDQFTQETGILVTPQVTRGVTQQLDADLSAGDPPDVADLPNPGAVFQYKRRLRPLGISLVGYAQPWRGLAMLGTDTVYTVPVKADVQSLIWYSASAVKSPPATWAALLDLSRQPGTPWCLGLASGVVSGWPGADWIADILMSTYQSDAYERWLNGTLAWNSPEVSYAWHEWGALIRHGAAVPGGVAGALETAFKKAISSRCAAEHGALIDTGLSAKAMAGYRYVRFPSVAGAASPALVSGDFMGLFTDNPDARRLLSYLALRTTQALWVSQASGDAFSADQAVPLADYKGVRRGIAAGLRQPGIERCFIAEDLMRPEVSAAFSQAVLEYVNNSHSLNDLLASLQLIQQGAGSSPVGKFACSGDI